MSGMEQSLPLSPSLSSSSDGKKRKRCSVNDSTPPPPCASPPSLPGTSSAGATSESAVFGDRVALDRLSSLVSGFIDKLNRTLASPDASTDTGNDFSGFYALSSSEDEAKVAPASQPDPLDGLDHLTRDNDVDEDFLRALGDLSGHFHGEEEKGEPLADSMATILNASLRRRRVSESVKLMCVKIKLLINVPNLTMPVTNAAITKAMSVNGRLVDAKLFQTNCLLTKAIVPIAVCVNDIGQKKVNPWLSRLQLSRFIAITHP
ncbi:hypothetical protein E2C01_041777 [Portunus trituberculatus]|uniref:Uncharacterized protein n=1 Tax=Portunus trituberculatus TaxID=210409 RepID=A0A5B7FSL4_PORTR|nr:hypothetical protein [Portunus trituberculatus]